MTFDLPKWNFQTALLLQLVKNMLELGEQCKFTDKLLSLIFMSSAF